LAKASQFGGGVAVAHQAPGERATHRRCDLDLDLQDRFDTPQGAIASRVASSNAAWPWAGLHARSAAFFIKG
jgi:hypothetical protein